MMGILHFLYQNVGKILFTSALGSARTGVPCSKPLLQVALGLHALQSQTCRFQAVEENKCQYTGFEIKVVKVIFLMVSNAIHTEEKCVVYTPYSFSVSAWAEVRL
jgi:hypothetical protein